MHRIKFYYVVAVIILCISCISCITVSDTGSRMGQVRSAVSRGNYDSAFLILRSIVNNKPNSQYAAMASFAVAEYYLMKKAYVECRYALKRYLDNYPDDKGVVFAEAMLYELSADKKNSSNAQELLDRIRERVFSKPTFFLFSSKSKRFSYWSVFDNNYTAVDYMDRVEILRNGKVYSKIAP
ncbi:tol-pal system YbgF family protein [Thermoproteota archaeon]